MSSASCGNFHSSLSLSNRNIQMVNVRFVKSFRFACRSINCNAPHDLNGSFSYFKSSLSLYIFGYWSSPTYFSRIPFSFFVGIFCSIRLVELDKLQSFWSEEAMVSMARERESIDGNIYGWHLIISSETFFMCNFKIRYQNFPLTFCCSSPPFDCCCWLLLVIKKHFDLKLNSAKRSK